EGGRRQARVRLPHARELIHLLDCLLNIHLDLLQLLDVRTLSVPLQHSDVVLVEGLEGLVDLGLVGLRSLLGLALI
ncbi:hypothetical protein PENTCL1PPCAC_3662, partial [Pristionchus entomophagus]